MRRLYEKNLVVEKKSLITDRDKNRSFDSLFSKNSEIFSPFKTSPYLIRRYRGFRHSLCHGWASGPTAWLTRFVLGVEILEPGCKKIRVCPHLDGLDWAKGSYPTPFGVIKLEHKRLPDGSIRTAVQASPEIELVYENAGTGIS